MKVANRNIGLDVLRAAAISMVFLSHGVTMTGLPVLGEFGTGVDLFFVLSGFLIGRIYFRGARDHSFSFWHFWRARWWRTLPPYIGGLAAYLLVRPLLAGARPQADLPWYYWLFLQNYLGITGYGPTWSLCVEEHFYLALPILALLIGRVFGRDSFRIVLPIAFFVPMLLRIGTLLALGHMPKDWYWMSHFHCEGLIAGLWMAYLFVDHREKFDALKKPSMWLLPLAPIVLFILPIWTTRTAAVNVYVFTLYALGYAAWVRFIYDLRWQPVTGVGRLAHGAARGLALCSYSVYLTHTTFMELFRGVLDEHMRRGAVRTVAVLVPTFLIGVGFYYLIERTAIVTRDKYLNREKRVPEPATV